MSKPPTASLPGNDDVAARAVAAPAPASASASASASVDAAADAADSSAPTIRALFLGFFELGITGFGGVLPFARRLIVDRRHWLSPQEFADLLGLCQILPGGNIINLSVALGLHFRGWRGALACIIALLSVPSVIVVALGSLYAQFAHVQTVRHIFAGLVAAAAGLLVSMAVALARPLLRRPLPAALAVLCFIAIALVRTPLLPTVLVLVPLGLLIAWRYPS